MYSRLEDGSVLISFEDEDTIPKISHSHGKTIKAMAKQAFHGMIYKKDDEEKEEKKHTIFHSSSGKKFGITTHPLLEMSLPIPLSVNPKLPVQMVIRCKDSKINKNLSLAAESWAVLTKVNPKYTSSSLEPHRLPATTFASFRAGDEDTPTMLGIGRKFELYRAFRAHWRNRQGKPLSKNKGASCSNYIGYSFKVAIIDRLFPGGVPESIQKKIEEIEGSKTKISTASTASTTSTASTSGAGEGKEEAKRDKASKLSQIQKKHPTWFDEFEKLVLLEYAKVGKKPSSGAGLPPETKSKVAAELKDSGRYLEFLYSSVKANDIQGFCGNVERYSELFEHSGYLFFIIGELTTVHYQKLLELKPTGDGQEAFDQLVTIKPGPLTFSSLQRIIELLKYGYLERDSEKKLFELLGELLIPALISHENYLKLLEKNDLRSYPYFIEEHVLKAHVAKAEAESPRPPASPSV